MSDNNIGRCLLFMFVEPEVSNAFLFVIPYKEATDLFEQAMKANGLLVNGNDEKYDTPTIDFVCDLSEQISQFQKGKLDTSTYQLYSIFNFYVDPAKEFNYSFDYVSSCSFLP